MTKRIWALVAAWCVAIIYGVTFTIAKDVMPKHIDAFGFIFLRVAGSMVLFWLTTLFVKTEKIDKKDFPRIIAASFFGVAFNMLTFFKGLSYTSPIMGAVLMVTTPMIVLILSAIIMKERMENQKILGILLGLAGTITLIVYGKSLKNASNATLGNFLVFVNAVSYGFYLIIVKKLMDKYNAFSFVKWIYLFGFLMVIPFGWNEFQTVEWSNVPTVAFLKIGFVVVFSTFLTYLLNLVSMRELKPTTVAVFIYLQPFFATLFAIGLGKDELSWIKVGSAFLIFIGVYLVTQKRRVSEK
ncbi:EamA family transporter [Flavobacterium columnare]|uniref:EamA/RhaT family transporter n=1 Tax=Flavobacterium columnare TaxID=996 RepID=A0AAI8CHP0_9FLAO|nr:DMT family transporter [Flavobacterium columnare]AMO20320.1 EamA/RhaT family transporter [Flavobacterium columnare]AUX18278.1 multidrug transporter [Flavobacterium columnare]QOG57356.1 EamA family transporter [Flavobacterium columnare]QOG60080.1 EamA family transporter [Flavobacterium columnare]QOG62800.1 EamA family transporter [Flavobacterium columnare]